TLLRRHFCPAQSVLFQVPVDTKFDLVLLRDETLKCKIDHVLQPVHGSPSKYLSSGKWIWEAQSSFHNGRGKNIHVMFLSGHLGIIILFLKSENCNGFIEALKLSADIDEGFTIMLLLSGVQR
uniref:Uncharacterized protein n=1 Tax=Strigamia maritima TaxID=126957 RepID=T1IWI6_STRMM